MSALLDHRDARIRLVHEWHDAGLSLEQIVEKLTPFESDVRRWLREPTDPPVPGSCRYTLGEWKARAQALERELHGAEVPADRPSRVPILSDLRELAEPAEDERE